MPEISIVLVEPIYEGNVGFAARAMKNFGFSRLILVSPCPLGDHARACASHAADVLEHAEEMPIEDVFATHDLAVATTGELSKSVCRSIRMPYSTPKELREQIQDAGGRVAILFGRENWGLNNAEVERCDMVCTIPGASEYPILNLSHAVAVICYELADLPPPQYRIATREEMECLYRHLDHMLDRVDHPAHKRKNTLIMMRRILGRTRLTTREVSTIHGLLRRAEWHMEADSSEDGE
ncbi:MAG: RNA methyltransferase [Methanomicrobiales archaeon]|nr:RNA methyltransferase [Methanomicrobiales archaeon]MDD1657976.1 RNA methyltransferase [Methanomicrobiales archaeon]